MGIRQYRLAQDIGVPVMRISKIVNGERGISANTALRLAHYFGNSVEFRTGIQTHYEIEKPKCLWPTDGKRSQSVCHMRHKTPDLMVIYQLIGLYCLS